MKAGQLTSRIQLWQRRIFETEEGDLAESWTNVGSVWAQVKGRLGESKPPDQGQVLEVFIRPTTQRFEKVFWQGQWYRLISKLVRDNETMGLKFLVREISNLT